MCKIGKAITKYRLSIFVKVLYFCVLKIAHWRHYSKKSGNPVFVFYSIEFLDMRFFLFSKAFMKLYIV